jgi:hypothetical protein
MEILLPVIEGISLQVLFARSSKLGLLPKDILSANDPQQDDHNGDHQKDVNETTHGVGSN